MSLEAIRQKYGLPSDEEIIDGLDRGHTLPAELYFAPEVHELEEEKVFSKSWLYACHESVLAKPGDYTVTQAGNTPIIVTHGRDGALNGFVNVCRHRLHSLAEGSGNKPLLQCPYHGWTYALDGQLKSAPRSDREPGFDCSTISLARVSVERWDQWVFVNPDPHAEPLRNITQEIHPYTDQLNADLREYQFEVRYEYDMECNWKIWAENAVECYHCPTLHRTSFGKTYDVSPSAYNLDSGEHTIWNDGPIKWLPGGVDPTGLKGFRFAFTFPSSFFALDDYVGFVGTIVPTGYERSFAYVDMYSKPGSDPTVVEEWLKMWDQTLLEDQQATEVQQVGYRSRRVPTGRLMLDSESPLQAFMRRAYASLTS